MCVEKTHLKQKQSKQTVIDSPCQTHCLLWCDPLMESLIYDIKKSKIFKLKSSNVLHSLLFEDKQNIIL